MAVDLAGNAFRNQETLLLNGTSAGWKFAHRMFPFTVDVNGSFAGTVTVYVSNAPDLPTDADANHAVLNTKTTPGAILSDGPYKFVKATGPAGSNAYFAATNSVPSR